MYFLYLTLTWLALVAAPFYAVIAILRRPRERHVVAERFGLHGGGPPLRGGVWLQAASVGELQVAGLLAPRLAATLQEVPILLTVTTPAARRMLVEAPAGVAAVQTFPLDLPPVVRRVARRLQPRLFIAIETELWPNLYTALARRGVPIALVNGRISDRSMARYERIRPLISRTLSRVHLVCARSAEDARRFTRLGLDAGRIQVTGDLKMDRPVPAAGNLESDLGHLLRGRRVLVAGSTHPGEEEVALEAGRRAAAGGTPITVILAPRHLQRLPQITALLQESGLPWLRRSSLSPGLTATGPLQVVLLDTHGELASLYSLSQVAFLGGTLHPVGGHNPLEAAAAGLPQVTGPHVHNVRHSVGQLRRVNALVSGETDAQVSQLLADLLLDAGRCREAGAAARHLLDGQRGALDRTTDALSRLLGIPCAGPRS